MMSSKKLFLKVDVKDGERTRKALLEHNLLDLDYKIVSQDTDLFMPLRQNVPSELMDTLLGSIHYDTGEMEFAPISHGPRNLTEALENHLTLEELELVPRAYDMIGDIAVLEIPQASASVLYWIGPFFSI